MQVGQFPASAASSLIEGYCDDFVSLATVLAQTLEQVSIRGIKLDHSRASLERIERGMAEMSTAIRELLERGKVTTEFEVTLGREKKPAPPAPQPAPAPTPAPAPAPAAASPTPATVPPPAPAAPAPRPAPPTSAPSSQPTARLPRMETPPATPPAPTPAVQAFRQPPTRSAKPLHPPLPSASTPRPAAQMSKPTPKAPATTPKRVSPPAPVSPVRTLIESLENERRQGTLYVQAGHETLAFEFVEGCITQTASDGIVADERLGDLLIEAGSCSRERLASVFSRLAPDGKHLLGEVLVRDGVVTNSQVVAALEVQTRKRLFRACMAADAHFDFADGELMPDDGRVRVSPKAMFGSAGQPPHGS